MDEELETAERHQFQANLGQGYRLVIGLNSASLADRQIRVIDTAGPEMDDLVKRPFSFVWTGDADETQGSSMAIHGSFSIKT